MSAYMVDRELITYLLDAAMSRSIRGGSSTFDWYVGRNRKELAAGDFQQAAKVGQMLWDENFASVTYRYSGDDETFDNLPGTIGESYVYRSHSSLYVKFDAVQIIKACHCFEYQSCEHPGWEASEAKAFIDSLINAAIHALPGYNDAKWGAPEPQTGLSRCR